MPSPIETLSRANALEEATDIAQRFRFTSPPVSIREHEEQGLFSRTFVVTLSDNTEAIVQLKDNEIDLTKVALARSILGEIVPTLYRAKSTGVYFAYVAPFIYGTLWHLKTERRELLISQEAFVASQIAFLMRKCSLAINSSDVVDSYVVPRLQNIMGDEDLTEDVRDRIEGLCRQTEVLKDLPLALCHIDINSRNVILDNKAHVVGLLDWEFATLLPFGMNAWCIRDLSVPCLEGAECVARTRPMTKRFWRALTADLLVEDRWKVVIAMQVGFVLLSAFSENTGQSSVPCPDFVERFDWLEHMFMPFCDDDLEW
ncbi:hypothetical protein VNI00_003010 [Paramarasmius palmivorus]|uniref:Aminoglycoside phosphotransferase domain-containing protein n=1 Tax=Paramarasmius palmivorus TaxID=297713 RepID=A0AAW0DXZ0_9AGAR